MGFITRVAVVITRAVVDSLLVGVWSSSNLLTLSTNIMVGHKGEVNLSTIMVVAEVLMHQVGRGLAHMQPNNLGCRFPSCTKQHLLLRQRQARRVQLLF